MTDPRTTLARSALAGHLHAGRIGRPGGSAGVTVRERTGRAIASIAARRGKAGELAIKVEARTGVVLPTKPGVVVAGHLSFAWAGSDQWLAMADGEDGTTFADDLARDLAGLAAVTDQSDGRVLLRIAGPDARKALAKGCMIDLHEREFAAGSTALTQIALVNVQLSRLPDEAGGPVFELSVMRSFAASLWHWIETSAAEFGLDVA